MKLRWSFRAANDRGPQAESRIPGESPAKSRSLMGFAFVLLTIKTARNLGDCASRIFIKHIVSLHYNN
jgi:hypothetical protein